MRLDLYGYFVIPNSVHFQAPAKKHEDLNHSSPNKAHVPAWALSFLVENLAPKSPARQVSNDILITANNVLLYDCKAVRPLVLSVFLALVKTLGSVLQAFFLDSFHRRHRHPQGSLFRKNSEQLSRAFRNFFDIVKTSVFSSCLSSFKGKKRC